MKITTQPDSDTDVIHTLKDTSEPVERTLETATAELRFNSLGVNVDLHRTQGGARIGGVFIEIYKGELRVMVWREEDLDSDACQVVALYDFPQPEVGEMTVLNEEDYARLKESYRASIEGSPSGVASGAGEDT